jgi:hypothetical protein
MRGLLVVSSTRFAVTFAVVIGIVLVLAALTWYVFLYTPMPHT